MNETTFQCKGLEFIKPLEITMPVDGVQVTISPLRLAELPTFLELAMPVFAALPGANADFFHRLAENKLTEAELSQLITAITVSGNDMIALLAFCTRQPADWTGALLIDRAAELLTVCLQVNSDFFRRVVPNIKALAPRAASEPGPAALQVATTN